MNNNTEFKEVLNGSSEAKNILWNSQLNIEGKLWKALPRSTRRDLLGEEKILFVLSDPTIEKIPSQSIRFWLETIRAISLTATATPGFAVLLWGQLLGWEINIVFFVMALMGALFMQIAINLWNDVYDHLKLIDLPGTLGGGGAIQKGVLSAREVNRWAWLFFTLGALLGLPILWVHPLLMGVIAIIAVIGVLGYSGPILNLKYRALGDINVFLLCGPALTAGFSLASFGKWDESILWIGAYFGFAAMAILHSNNLQDILVDRLRGAKTLASLLGFVQARHGLWVLYLLGYLSLGVLALNNTLFLIPMSVTLLGLPIAVSLSIKGIKASGPESGYLSGIRIKTAQFHLLLGVLLCLGLIIGIYFV